MGRSRGLSDLGHTEYYTQYGLGPQARNQADAKIRTAGIGGYLREPPGASCGISAGRGVSAAANGWDSRGIRSRRGDDLSVLGTYKIEIGAVVSPAPYVETARMAYRASHA
jgi:hypothetical protein